MARPFCPLCASEDDTAEETTSDGRIYFTCADRSHGSDPFVWEPSPPPKRSRRGDGLGAELGIWEKLLECVRPGADFQSYGDVEDMFFTEYPREADLLLQRYGHRWRSKEHPSTQYSMSVYLSSRLRDLADEGLLELRYLPATGPWAYNGIISHWRKAGQE